MFLYVFRAADQQVVIGGRTFSDREILGVLVVATVFVVFLTSVGSLLMSSLFDWESLSGGGLFGSFTGGATSAAVADVMARFELLNTDVRPYRIVCSKRYSLFNMIDYQHCHSQNDVARNSWAVNLGEISSRSRT
ncbi:PRA1 family protein B3 [Tanacetum coccineum]